MRLERKELSITKIYADKENKKSKKSLTDNKNLKQIFYYYFCWYKKIKTLELGYI